MNPYLGVLADMAGCPNRCRHCWLGEHKNGSMQIDDFLWIADQFKGWRGADGQGIAELGFFSWWREPDYRPDYRELWALEKRLSSPGRAQRFELLSTWRLARDEDYARWAADNGPRACQISFFGMEEGTDWGMRRKGAFADQLKATERCLDAGIAPRWQLFPLKRNVDELGEFLRLMRDLRLWARCEAIGQPFVVFMNSFSPEGAGYALEDQRIEQGDIARVPEKLVALCRGGLRPLGQPENRLMQALLQQERPPNIGTSFPALAVDADFDVYPNIAEPAPWWRLGNLRADGVESVLSAYLGGATPGMRANSELPVRELARCFGDTDSDKLYDGDDLVVRLLHQWGAARG